jgi:hypothetical protein
MKFPGPRTVAFAAAAAVALTATLGCGFISAAGNLAGNLSTIGDLADKINNSEHATFTATYKLQDGTPVVVAQQPPNSATVGPKGRFIATPDAYYICDKSSGSWVCQKSPANGNTGTGDAAIASGLTGNGFISAPLAVAVLTAAMVVPKAHVDKSTETIAGQKSTCAKVSNLEQAQQNESNKVTDFTVCVTDTGVLARFEGTSTDGTKANIELTAYSSTVDSGLFAPPAEAKINDVGQLEVPTPAAT